MHISPFPPVPWKHILLAGRFGHQNMGDELIMLGNIKQLLIQHKTIYILIWHHERVQQRLNQNLTYTQMKHITLLPDIPRGIRSLYKYLSHRVLYYHRRADTIILWGGEIITPETQTGYRYRRPYIRPTLFHRNLIIMGGIQTGKHRRQRILLQIMLYRSHAVRARDLEVVETISRITSTPVSRVMDTSRYACDREHIRTWHTTPTDTLIININSKWLHHLSDILSDIKKNISDTTHIYYIPVCAGPQDDDSRRFKMIKDTLIQQGIHLWSRISLLDRRFDFYQCIQTIQTAKMIISPRLHLYLISQYLHIPTIVYPYQRKILKMQQELIRLSIGTSP